MSYADFLKKISFDILKEIKWEKRKFEVLQFLL